MNTITLPKPANPQLQQLIRPMKAVYGLFLSLLLVLQPVVLQPVVAAAGGQLLASSLPWRTVFDEVSSDHRSDVVDESSKAVPIGKMRSIPFPGPLAPKLNRVLILIIGHHWLQSHHHHHHHLRHCFSNNRRHHHHRRHFQKALLRRRLHGS